MSGEYVAELIQKSCSRGFCDEGDHVSLFLPTPSGSADWRVLRRVPKSEKSVTLPAWPQLNGYRTGACRVCAIPVGKHRAPEPWPGGALGGLAWLRAAGTRRVLLVNL